jgi:hypothetical protein
MSMLAGSSSVPAWVKGDVTVFVLPEQSKIDPVLDALRERDLITWLTCAQCGNNVARTSDRIEVNGKHEHTFINPMGVIYRIGCFGAAPGTIEVGQPSDEFAWFRGHLWRIAVCSRCTNHLGWSFTSDSAQFYGLVLENLREPGS